MPPTIRIPLNVYAVTLRNGTQSSGPRWTNAEILGVVGDANAIWRQADIEFVPGAVQAFTLDVPGSVETVDNQSFQTLSQRLGNQATPTVAFVRQSLGGSNSAGRAIAARRFLMLAFQNSPLQASRYLAHELGHNLGLSGHYDDGHNPNDRRYLNDSNNLMYSGLLTGAQLTRDQITRARGSPLARQYGGP